MAGPASARSRVASTALSTDSEIGHVHRRSVADLLFSEQGREEPNRLAYVLATDNADNVSP